MSNIKKISAIQILDSRGNPTLETSIELEDGTIGTASVPSGKSTGKYEAVELRDNESEHFDGKGVNRAIENVNDKIAEAIVGLPIEELSNIDKTMIGIDYTENKSALGANAILSVSLACARALSKYQHLPLWQVLNEYYFADIKPSFPRFMINIVNGGAHAAWAFDIQEYKIIPRGKSPQESLEIGSEIFNALGILLESKGLSTLKGDEGGYAPNLDSNTAPFDLILEAANKSNHSQDFDFGIDVAASEFFKDGKYHLKKENKFLSSSELIDYYQSLMTNYHLLSVEDPFAEEDWDSFTKFTAQLGSKCLVIGDDLYTTNPKRIEQGVKVRATNAVLIKPNQIGSLYETVAAIKMTISASWKVIISHRSGETEDSFIADLSYACGADFIKAGSMSRSERLAKYNRLVEIEKNEI